MENEKKRKQIHPLLVVVIIILCLYGGCYGLVLKSAFDIVESSRQYHMQRDCDIALLPELSNFVGRSDSKDGYTVYATSKYKNVDALCKALPTSYGDAVRHALNEGSYTVTTDDKNGSVKCYEITEGLPFASAEDMYEGYAKAIKLCTKHVNVLEYDNGKLKFQLMINIPDEAFQPDRTKAENQTFYVFQHKGVLCYLPGMTYISREIMAMDGHFAKVTADVEWVEGYQINWNHDYVEKCEKHPDILNVINVEEVPVEEVYNELCVKSKEDIAGLYSLKGYTDEGDYFMEYSFSQDPIYILYQANEKKYVYDGSWYKTEFGTVCYKGNPDKKAVLQKIKDTGILCCEEYFVVPKKEDNSDKK
ncbi:MAG: hypothetical protein J6Z33_07145 [Lachnospiraceae bacterium]|nr:hypothetical protein [Lachnospiraceae bacterium]